MSHPEMQSICVSFTDEDMKNPEKAKALNEFFDAMNDSMAKYCDEVGNEVAKVWPEANEKQISHCACDVAYLRSRSRWTQRMEDELIRLHRAGTPPNVFDWPERDSDLRD